MIALPFSRLLSLQILLLLSTRSRSQDMILLSSCGNINYTTGSPFESNLRSLITKLIFSTWNSSFFYTTTIGKSPDAQIFGLAQCRPDVSAANCIDCLNITANGCPLSKSAALRANQCVLRYSDQHFFSTVDMSQFESISNPENASNSVVFERTVNDLMYKLFVEAFKAESKLGVGKANYSLIGDIYGMAWCTQDLSSGDCQQCFDRVVNLLPVEKLGARVMTVSCIARFEIFHLCRCPTWHHYLLLMAAAAIIVRTPKVWKYWNQGTSLQMVDQCLGHEYESQEVLRCLHIGLLCVQDDLLLRPSMASVMVMISSHSAMIPAPSTPPFSIGGSSYGDSHLSVRETEHNL